MKFFCTFILLFAIACSSIFGLMNSENEKFIQGKWQVSGENKNENGAAQSWFLEWEFENGRFNQNGYPPLQQEGNYKIIEDRNDTIKLKLYKQDGTFGVEDSELKIVVDRENKKLRIEETEDYTKITNQKTS